MKPPLTPDEEERQGMILALIVVGLLSIFFLAWIQYLCRPHEKKPPLADDPLSAPAPILREQHAL